MDQNILVVNGHNLIEVMSGAGVAPRGAMWVHNSDTDVWRLWIVPSQGLTDKREFYRRVSELISKNQSRFISFDAGDIEMVSESHPAVKGIRKMFKITAPSSVFIKNNMLNGFYVPDGIVLLMNI